MLIDCLEAQRITIEDVSPKHKARRAEESGVRAFLRNASISFPRPCRRADYGTPDVVVQQLNSVYAADGHERILLPFVLGLAIALVHNVKLAAQHLHEEVAVAACGLEETRVDTLGLLLHHVEHRVDFTLVGEDLSVLPGHAFVT